MNFIEAPLTRPTGALRVQVFRRGELVEDFEEKNLVVDGYRLAHPRLLAGVTAGYAVTQIGFGTNGASPVPGNTTLTGAFLKNLDAPTFPAANRVSFPFSLGAAEANGLAILEYGLLTSSGLLYARRTRTVPLNKDSDLSFAGAWTITF